MRPRGRLAALALLAAASLCALACSRKKHPSITIAAHGSIDLPSDWTACDKDADCDFAALGCCDVLGTPRLKPGAPTEA
jgi:hypothetical protein